MPKKKSPVRRKQASHSLKFPFLLAIIIVLVFCAFLSLGVIFSTFSQSTFPFSSPFAVQDDTGPISLSDTEQYAAQ